MNTRSPVECPSWAKLVQHAESWRTVHLRELFSADAARARQFTAEAPGVRYDYSRQRLGAMTVRLLTHLAAERGFAEWREALLAGSAINSTENRPAWHSALRAGDSAPAEVKETLSRVQQLVEKLRSEKRFKRVVNLGTGGSDLGPRLVADALSDGELDVRFAANVDPRDLERAMAGAELSSTLFVVVSKTFTTLETMANAERAKALGAKNFIAVSANTAAAKALAPPTCCRCGTGSAGASRCGRRPGSPPPAPSAPTPSGNSCAAATISTAISWKRPWRKMSRR
jgi:glucose-6-phosphate isomerase